MLLVNIVSVVVPIVVVLLLGIRKLDLGPWTKNLPHLNGAINTLTAILLVIGFALIKRGNIRWHRNVMVCAFSLGAIFLVSYVTYHATNASTPFGGQGTVRYFYYFVLISHIGMSLIVLPLVLRAILFAWLGEFERHRRVAKFALPIWLYVSVTGVIAYWMISPYYQ